MAKIYIVDGKGDGKGGFCFHNVGDKKLTLMPGIENAFDENLIEKSTKLKYLEDGHLKYTGETDEPKAPKAPKAPAKVEQQEVPKQETKSVLEKYGVTTADFDKVKDALDNDVEALSDLSIEDLQEIVQSIFEQKQLVVPVMENKEDALSLLTIGK